MNRRRIEVDFVSSKTTTKWDEVKVNDMKNEDSKEHDDEEEEEEVNEIETKLNDINKLLIWYRSSVMERCTRRAFLSFSRCFGHCSKNRQIDWLRKCPLQSTCAFSTDDNFGITAINLTLRRWHTNSKKTESNKKLSQRKMRTKKGAEIIFIHNDLGECERDEVMFFFLLFLSIFFIVALISRQKAEKKAKWNWKRRQKSVDDVTCVVTNAM